MEILQPEGWKKPSGYSNGVRANGDMIFVAGQVGWNQDCEFESSDLADQVRQALTNVLATLKAGGAGADQIVRMTWYVADVNEYRARAREIGSVYREVMGNHYPAMTLVQVARLYDDGAKVEIEATAVIERN